MNKIGKFGMVVLTVVITGCTSIPEKIPKLIEISANSVDNQSALVVAEWESSIAAVNSSKKMLELIHTYVISVDQSKLSASDKTSIGNFLKGYPYVIKQLDSVLSQKNEPQKSLSRFKDITNAIRLANSYVAKTVDENSRIEGVIESINSLRNKETEDDKGDK